MTIIGGTNFYTCEIFLLLSRFTPSLERGYLILICIRQQKSFTGSHFVALHPGRGSSGLAKSGTEGHAELFDTMRRDAGTALSKDTHK
jgi:hypothetical protein